MKREGGEFEHGTEEKNLESRSEFLKYLVRVAGSAEYSVPVRKKALEIYQEVQRYPTVTLTRSHTGGSHERLLNKHFDTLSALFVDIRKLLISSGKGDSECAQIIDSIHTRLT